MNSFLKTLAVRALDQSQPIKPRLPSLFEPATAPHVNFREVTVNKLSRPEERKSERSEPDTVSPASQTLVPKSAARVLRREPEAIAEAADRTASIKSSSESIKSITPETRLSDGSAADLIEHRSTQVKPESEEEPAQIDRQSSSLPESIKPTVRVSQAVTIEQTNLVEQAGPPAPQREAAAHKAEGAQPGKVESILIEPEITARAAEINVIQPQLLVPESPPSVKITIGRIDVRAVMPPAQSTVPSGSRTSMKALSLDEYLKKRNGGQR